MEQSDIKFDKIVNRLRDEKPILHQPELLTKNILESLPLHKSKLTPVLKWTRILSSSAAAFLLVLFSFQQFDIDNKSFTQTETSNSTKIFKMDININIEKSYLLVEYKKYMYNNSLKNEKLRSYTQL